MKEQNNRTAEELSEHLRRISDVSMEAPIKLTDYDRAAILEVRMRLIGRSALRISDTSSETIVVEPTGSSSIEHGKRLESCAKGLHNLKMQISGMAIIGGIPQEANHIVRDCIDATLVTIRDALADKNWGKKS